MKKIITAIIAATVVGLTAHIYLLRWIDPLISHLMEGKAIAQAPYNFAITSTAYITFVLPVMGITLLYYWIGDKLPFQTKLAKGLVMGFFLLFIKGDLIRQPIMNYLVGSPFSVVLLQIIQVWLPNLILCVLIALLFPEKQNRASGHI